MECLQEGEFGNCTDWSFPDALIDSDGTLLFGDFGAASIFSNLNTAQQRAIKTIEHRAVGYFIEDLLSICRPEHKSSKEYAQLLELSKTQLPVSNTENEYLPERAEQEPVAL